MVPPTRSTVPALEVTFPLFVTTFAIFNRPPFVASSEPALVTFPEPSRRSVLPGELASMIPDEPLDRDKVPCPMSPYPWTVLSTFVRAEPAPERT